MHLTKHHGLGNDFLVALDESNGRALVEVDADLARRLCDRHRGIGADGLIRGERPSSEQVAQGIDLVMHLFNADGSRAEMSGNGVRCLGHALTRARGLGAGTIVVSTDAGLRPLHFDTPTDAHTVDVSVDMGAPAPGPDVPAAVVELLRTRYGTVDMGNPHLVVQVDDLDSVDLAVEGPMIERHFGEGINVEFIAPGPGPDEVRMRVWERGSGITLACGTGACAVAHKAIEWGLTGPRVIVSMPGGEAELTVDGNSIELRSAVVHIASIEIERDDPDRVG